MFTLFLAAAVGFCPSDEGDARARAALALAQTPVAATPLLPVIRDCTCAEGGPCICGEKCNCTAAIAQVRQVPQLTTPAPRLVKVCTPQGCYFVPETDTGQDATIAGACAGGNCAGGNCAAPRRGLFRFRR